MKKLLSDLKKTRLQHLQISRNIRLRLTLWYAATLLLILLAFGITIYLTQMDAQYAVLDGHLRQDTAMIATAYDTRDGALRLQAPLPGRIVALLVTPGGEVEQVLAPGELQTSDTISLAQHARAMSSHQAFDAIVTFITPKGTVQQNYRFTTLALPAMASDRAAGPIVVVGERNGAEGALFNLALTLLIAGMFFLLCSTLSGFWLANRAMQPVRTITRMAQQLSETDLSRRLHLTRRDELGELGQTFDQMLERLEVAFERQRQFLADASHELRTPLSIVHLEAARMLEQPSTHEECLQALALIQRVSASLSHLVNNLLLLARAGNGSIPLKRERLDLSDIVFEVVESLVPLAHRQHIRLILGQAPELLLQGDRLFLSQMMTNLVENAIKYTARVGTQVHVEAGYKNEDEQMWGWVRVTDDGPGIAAQHLPHLFERFYAVDPRQAHELAAQQTVNDTSGKSSGSGLGLAIAQWVAQAHQGTIHIRSEPGHGSVFEIWLPCFSSGGR